MASKKIRWDIDNSAHTESDDDGNTVPVKPTLVHTVVSRPEDVSWTVSTDSLIPLYLGKSCKLPVAGQGDIARSVLQDDAIAIKWVAKRIASDTALVSEDGTPVLIMASAFNSPICLRYTLQSATSIDDHADTGQFKGLNALHCACAFGSVTIARLLLSYGADIRVKTRENQFTRKTAQTCLHLAVENNQQFLCSELETEFECIKDELDADGLTILHIAARAGYFGMVRTLIQIGCDPNVCDRSGLTPLHHAIILRHTTICGQLLTGTRLDGRGRCQYGDDLAPVHLMAILGQLTMLKRLINISDDATELTAHLSVDKWPLKSVDVNILHMAALYGHLDMVKFLTKHKTFDNISTTNNSLSPLLFSVLGNHTRQVVQLSNESNVQEEIVFGLYIKLTLLHVAIHHGLEDMVAILLRLHADPNKPLTTNENQITYPLHNACKTANEAIVRLLIRNGADSQKRDSRGRVALHIASETDVRIVQVLREHEENRLGTRDTITNMLLSLDVVKHRDLYRMTWVEMASEHAKVGCGTSNTDCQEQNDVENYQNVTTNQIRNNEGRLPVHVAALRGHVDVLTELILWEPALLDAPDEDGFTPLHHVTCLRKHIDATRLLLQLGAGTCLTNCFGYTPLHCAVEAHNTDALLAMVMEGDMWSSFEDIEVNDFLEVTTKTTWKTQQLVSMVTHDGNTALHLATRLGYKTIAEIVLTLYANIDMQNTDGMTPLHMAAQRGDEAMVIFLINKGAKLNLLAKVTKGKMIYHDVTPLHISVLENELNACKRLIDAGCYIDSYCKINTHVYNIAPIHLSICNRQEQITLLLIDAGCDINCFQSDRNSPLSLALKYSGSRQVFLKLLKADINVAFSFFPGRLSCALEVVGLQPRPWFPVSLGDILDAGGDVNFRTELGRTVLHSIVKYGQVESMIMRTLTVLLKPLEILMNMSKCHSEQHIAETRKSLSSALVNLDTYDELGHTVLGTVVKRGFVKVTRLFLSLGGDVNFCSQTRGETPLLIAIRHRQIDIVRVLCESKKLVTSADVIMQIVYEGDVELLIVVIERGLDCNLTIRLRDNGPCDVSVICSHNPHNGTMLHQAALDGKEDFVTELIKRKCINIDAEDEAGRTALYLAIYNGHRSLALHLLAMGASINKVANYERSGYTLLHLTTSREDELSSSLLCVCMQSTDVRTDFENNPDVTPLHLAAMSGNVKMVSMLLRHSANPYLKTGSGLTCEDIARESEHMDILTLIQGSNIC